MELFQIDLQENRTSKRCSCLARWRKKKITDFTCRDKEPHSLPSQLIRFRVVCEPETACIQTIKGSQSTTQAQMAIRPLTEKSPSRNEWKQTGLNRSTAVKSGSKRCHRAELTPTAVPRFTEISCWMEEKRNKKKKSLLALVTEN